MLSFKVIHCVSLQKLLSYKLNNKNSWCSWCTASSFGSWTSVWWLVSAAPPPPSTHQLSSCQLIRALLGSTAAVREYAPCTPIPTLCSVISYYNTSGTHLLALNQRNNTEYRRWFFVLVTNKLTYQYGYII